MENELIKPSNFKSLAINFDKEHRNFIEKYRNSSMIYHEYNILPGSLTGVRSVNISASGLFLITSTNNNRVNAWDLSNGVSKFIYHGHDNTVRNTFFGNGCIFSCSWDGTCHQFDLQGNFIKKFTDHCGRMPSVTNFGNLLFTASYDDDVNPGYYNTGRCWDIETGKVMYRYPHSFRESVETIKVDYDPVKKLVYTGSDDRCVYKWELTSKKLGSFEGHQGAVRCVKLAKGGEILITACQDQKIRLYNTSDCNLIREIHEFSEEVIDIAVTADDIFFAAASFDGRAALFELDSGLMVREFAGSFSDLWSVCFGNRDKLVITGSTDGLARFYNLETGDYLCGYHNFSETDDFLWVSPPDETRPDGFFYTNHPEKFIRVMKTVRNKQSTFTFQVSGEEREEYIRKHNQPNAIFGKIWNYQFYKQLEDENRKRKKDQDGFGRLLLTGTE